MGCGTSKGVKVQSTNGVAHQQNGSYKKINSVGTTTDAQQQQHDKKETIRGDRLSLIDARNKRETDAIDRRRRLSQLQAEEVDKARSRSRQSSIGGDRSLSSGEKTPVKEIKRNGTDYKTNSNRSVRSDEEYSPKLEIKIEHISDTENEVLPERLQKISDIQEHPTESSSPKTIDSKDSPSPSHNSKIVFQERPNPRQSNDIRRSSIDSIDIKNNANDIVNDVMSKALFTIKTEDQKPPSKDLITTYESSRTSLNSAKTDSSMDAQAKSIVDNMLSRAMLQVKMDQSKGLKML